MEKTIEQWYELLPEPIRSEALEARKKAEARNPSLYPKGERTESLCDALYDGFSWEIDGGDYGKWIAIHRRAKAGEFDPKPTATPIDLAPFIDTITAICERIAELEGKLDAITKILNP